MNRLLLTAAIPFAVATTAFADEQMAKFPEFSMETGKDFFGSDLIGMRIYQSENEYDTTASLADGTAQEWDDIGEIGDLVISQSGELKAVIVDIGGFLGMGEKELAVTFDDIKVLHEEDDPSERFLVLTTNTDSLKEAPVFSRGEAMESDTNMAETGSTKLIDDRPMLRAPEVEREGYLEAKIDELKAEDIQGTTVYGANDDAVGEVGALVMSDDGTVERAIIDVGGFLGMGEKPVAVTFEELKILKGESDNEVRIYIDATEAELEALPEYEG